LFEKPKEKDFTSINNLESCPGLDYTKSAFLLSLSYLLIDLICFSFFYFIEFLILRKIEHLLQNNINHLKNNSTINSTNNKNKQMSNIENKEEFKKDETSFIIVENNQQKGPIIEIKKKEISDSKISTILKIENNEKELEFRHKKVKNLKVSNSSRLQLINLNVLENEEKKDEKENNNQIETKKDDLKVNQSHKNKIFNNFNSNPSFFSNSEEILPIENIKKDKKKLKAVIYNNDNSLNSKQILK